MKTRSVSSLKHPVRILILGATGMLGHMLVRVLSTDFIVFGTALGRYDKNLVFAKTLPENRWINHLDAENWDSVKSVIHQVSPTVIINCVGLVKQRMTDQDILRALCLNSLTPHRLAAICEFEGIKLVHISTDCVFDGGPGIKRLSDVPNATDLYGTTKRLGEVVRGNALTLRTGFVGRQLSNFDGLFEWILSKKGSRVTGYKNAIYSGLTTMTLGHVIDDVLKHHYSLAGLYQVASTPISKFDLISKLNELLNLKLTIDPDFDFVCDRSLDGTRFFEDTNIRVPSWDQMLVEFVKDQQFYESH